MPSFEEIEAGSVEEAIKQASKRFQIAEDKLQYEVISKGSTGIFGLVGVRKAKIKVRVKDETCRCEPPRKTLAPVAVSAEESPSPAEPDKPENKTGEEAAPVAKTILINILSHFQIENEVSAEGSGSQVHLSIHGSKIGILIGRKGQTLDALQYIVNKIINKTFSEKVKVTIDTEEYRKRRDRTLSDLALKMSEKAKRIGKPVTISPMNAHDRRIIHLTLQNIQGVRTKSKGEGLMKKIVIIPQKLSSDKSAPQQPAE
ncbi:MAG: Jag N-terminal domain-containing protein [Deltaproteobacteria bacterium]|nr:Jag N-terminal domain-containing protein [Deltaproteobacteria bacterium]